MLSVTLRLLERAEDPAAVTIARVVAAARCTPPSLYHYWATREALLREASARGWEQFRRSQQPPVEAAGSPLQRIRSRGRAYLSFARRHPSLFRALFLSGTLSPPAAAERAAPGPALDALVADVTDAMEAGLLRREEPVVVALALWAAVHGVATLCATNPELPEALADDAARLQQDAILAGLAGPAALPR